MTVKQENHSTNSEQEVDSTTTIKQEVDYSEFIHEEEILTEKTSNDYEVNLLFQDLTEDVSLKSFFRSFDLTI